MVNQTILILTSAFLLFIALYFYIQLQEQENKIKNLIILKQELENNVSSLNKDLEAEINNRIKLAKTLETLSKDFSNLSKEHESLKKLYEEIVINKSNLEKEYKNILQNLTKNQTIEEWEIFKNLSKWFQENLEFHDTSLRSKILLSCSDGFTMKLPCASRMITYFYGYRNNINEFDSAKMLYDKGYSDCKGHALFYKAFLKSLPKNMFLEAMKKVPLIEYTYYSYNIDNTTSIDGYTSHLFDRIMYYDVVVVCFNSKNKGHCGVLLTPINVSSYKDIKIGFVVDPLKGEVLGDVGNKFNVCYETPCNKENQISLIIHDNWIEYYYNGKWNRLE